MSWGEYWPAELSYESEWEASGLDTPVLVPSFPSFTSSRLWKDNVGSPSQESLKNRTPTHLPELASS